MMDLLAGMAAFIRDQVANDIFLRTFGFVGGDLLLILVAEVGDATIALSQGLAVAGDGGWFEAVDDAWNTQDGWWS